jgi:acetolactate synthase-1/2/3 large subunit
MAAAKSSHASSRRNLDSAPRVPHALAGQTVTGADAIVQVLADEGVDTIFGYSGGAILPTYDAIFRYNANRGSRPEVRLIVPATEQGAGFMAAGYSRSSGRVGVSLVTSGPGATNSVTPVRDCQADSIPMVLICGQVARAAMGTDAFQEAPVFNIMMACAKHVFLIKDEAQVEATLRTAFHIARSGRPGPVVIDVPKDVQSSVSAASVSPCGYRERVERSSVGRRRLRRGPTSAARVEASAIYAGAADQPSAARISRALSRQFGIPFGIDVRGTRFDDTGRSLVPHAR